MPAKPGTLKMCGGGLLDTLAPSFAVYEKPLKHDRQKKTPRRETEKTNETKQQQKPAEADTAVRLPAEGRRRHGTAHGPSPHLLQP